MPLALDKFKIECEKLVMVRRMKWRRKGKGSISDHWECIGSGYYSEVWRHEHYHGLVCKISGTAGWGNDPAYNSKFHKAQTTYVKDAWPEYARFCMSVKGDYANRDFDHLPEVYSIDQLSDGISWAILKAYTPAININWDDRLKLCKMMQSEYWAIKMREDVEKIVGETSLDFHGGNFMYDDEHDTYIVSDPLSTTPQDTYVNFAKRRLDYVNR